MSSIWLLLAAEAAALGLELVEVVLAGIVRSQPLLQKVLVFLLRLALEALAPQILEAMVLPRLSTALPQQAGVEGRIVTTAGLLWAGRAALAGVTAVRV
jgi:hypothetical protein